MKKFLIALFLFFVFCIILSDKLHCQTKPDSTITTPVEAKYFTDSTKVFIEYVNLSGKVMADSLWQVRSGYVSIELKKFLTTPKIKFYRFSGNEFGEDEWILQMWPGTRTPPQLMELGMK